MGKSKGYTKVLSTAEAESARKWWIVDATGITLGRLSAEVAAIIRGKNKVTFTPHIDCGDSVIVTNAELIKVTGSKLQTKVYNQHTGFIGHMNSITLGDQLKKHPERVIEEAVFGMLPKGVLGKQSMRRRLKVVAGKEHKYSAQQPQPYQIKTA